MYGANDYPVIIIIEVDFPNFSYAVILLLLLLLSVLVVTN